MLFWELSGCDAGPTVPVLVLCRNVSPRENTSRGCKQPGWPVCPLVDQRQRIIDNARASAGIRGMGNSFIGQTLEPHHVSHCIQDGQPVAVDVDLKNDPVKAEQPAFRLLDDRLV